MPNDTPVPMTNPVGRLYHVMVAVRKAGWPGNRFTMMRQAFATKDDRELLKTIVATHQLVEEAREACNLHKLNEPRHIQSINSAEELFDPAHLYSNSQPDVQRLTGDRVTTMLEMTALQLARDGYRDGPDPSAVDELLPQIADMEKAVVALDCDETLKEVLLESLSIMREAVIGYRRYGPRALRNALKVATMNVFQEVKRKGTPAREVVERVGYWEWLNRASSVIQVSTSASELLPFVAIAGLLGC